MKNWVFIFKKSDLSALGSVRCWPNMQAAETETEIWLRCPVLHSDLDEALRRLPAMYTYRENKDGLLFPVEGLSPIASLPTLEWINMREFIPVELPTAALPGQMDQTYTLKLVPSSTYHPGAALRTNLSDWQQYAETAPAIRLDQLRFALAANGEVLVMGQPLPSVPGEEYWLREQLLLPSGYDLELPITATLMAMRENVAGAKFLFEKNGDWQKIEHNNFVPATRLGIRLSKANP
ncbi:hypothetical protein [Haliscomenobacter hydrossis]|uniref:MoxR-vWA-beta-propeller ternary system domain-containing protein n=1 Tax=Haliscomenobacter hydrossis (strain ATCC 27775 / DSM 1100 / LMG 10767 / O) TaxID=760192 RepID=F4L0D0_HALH1|nr:hypothetical protein [Haliscomenobacter hydrossis]AEE53803.1 hypothetical protein Halhy_5980 [Haliscomenobacter hydrossis DSM 1100]